MKKLIFTGILFLNCTFVSFSQSTYFPFPDSNARWNVIYGGYEPQKCEKYTCSLNGDTTVNGVKYVKLLKKGFSYPFKEKGCDFDVPGSPIESYAGAIRQDTLNRRVYFLPPGKSKDTLLYDFNLRVGDTLKTYNSFYDEQVVSIDSILIGNQYRKSWNIGGHAIIDAKIIEGIGSTLGLLELLANFESGGNLVCFSQNGKSLYPEYSPTSECPSFTGIKKTQNDFEVQIFPNPSNGIFTLNASIDGIEISAFNILGKRVYQTQLIKKMQVNLSDQPAGVYQILIHKNGELLKVEKLLICH